MRSIVLSIFLVLLVTFSNCENLVRKKRFLSSLWPSKQNDKDKREVVYLHLPPEYIEMMHHELQSRSDAQNKNAMDLNSQQVRFVKPTKMMAIFRQPARSDIQIQELPLPEIHTTHRFVTPTPFSTSTQKLEIYNEQQSLPIKRVSNNVVSLPSIKTADISDFYNTREFNELLNEFKIKVDIQKLPDIQDVMIILGTDDAEETLKVIREVANTSEGMELLTSYLKGNDRVEEDQYYNIDDDIGAGEIQVSDYNKNYIQPYVTDTLQSDDASQYNYAPVENPITAEPESLSWWQKPLSWFGYYGDVKSTKVEAVKTNAEIIANVVHDPEGLGRFGYTRKFLSPLGHREETLIDPPLKVTGTEESRLISSEIYEAPSTLKPIQMTEEDFDRMVKDLRLTPINPPVTTFHSQLPIPTTITPQPPITTTTTPQPDVITTTEEPDIIIADESKLSLPIHVAETFEIDIPDPQIPQKVIANFEPLETTRRSFESLSEPVRHSPIESRTGKVFRADPSEVLKESKSIAVDFEDDKEVVAAVSDLTEQAMKEQVDEEEILI